MFNNLLDSLLRNMSKKGWELYGIEMFPATDIKQLDYIKSVTDKSDYYILILAGRYGTLANDGISYTEKEYNYAKRKGIPILVFIRENIDELPSKYVDSDKEKVKKMQKFRTKVKKGRLVSFWKNSLELKVLIHDSLVNEFRTNPRKGWIKETELYNINSDFDRCIDFEHRFEVNCKINKDVNYKQFMADKKVKKLLSDNRVLPIGYNINTGDACGPDLSRIFCYMISGKRRTGKTNALKILIGSVLAKGDSVYIIELERNELKDVFANTKAVTAGNVEAVYEIFKDIVPTCKERNACVLECINKAYTNEEIFEEMKRFSKIHIFIEDLVLF